MRQIQTEKGESLFFFQNTNPILFVIFISYCFDLLYQRGYQRYDFLEIKWKKCRPMRQLRPETGGISCNFFQNTDQVVFVLFITLFLTNCIKNVIDVNTYGH